MKNMDIRQAVNHISSFDCDVTIMNGEKTASGKSVIGMMALDC